MDKDFDTFTGNLTEEEYLLSFLETFENGSLYDSDYGLYIPGDSDFLPQDFSHILKITLAVLYSLIAAGAILGNICVLLVILCNPALRTVTNTFILSLTASDTLIAAWNIPLQLLFYLKNEWGFGEAMCKATSFVQGVSILASILTLVAISIERYYVICNPIQARYIRSTKSAVVTVIGLWLVTFVIMMPQLWIQRLQQRLAWQSDAYQPIKIAYLCVEYFSKFAYNVSYSYGFFVIFYLAPFAVMTYAYGHMAKVLWLRTHIEEAIVSVQVSDKRETQKRSIIRMLIAIVLCFTICWLPFFSVHIVLLHCPITVELRIAQAFALLCGYSNSFLNPFIYFFLNTKFNRVLCKIFACKPFSKTRRSIKYTRKPTTQVTMT